MTTHEMHHWGGLRVCLLVCVFGSGIVAILASAGRPTTSTPPAKSFPDVGMPAGPPRVETKPVGAIWLREAAPADVIPDRANAIRLVHTITERGGDRMSQWRYTSTGQAGATHRGMTFAFGLTPLELQSTLAAEGVDAGPVLGLTIEISNATQGAAHIDWGSVALIGPTGTAERVIHRGVRLSDRAGAAPPALIPPGAKLEDFLYPSRLVSYSPSRYGSSWYGDAFFEVMRPGQRFRLYLPVRHGGGLVEYQFTFAVEPAPAP